MKKLISIWAVMLSSLAITAQTELPQVVSGTIERLEQFPSEYISSRNIDIWLPDGYTPSKKYAVLYMHDGQMLYDPQNTWNGQAWDVDDTATDLLKAHRVKDFIVVGVWNGGVTRHSDYFPQKPYEALSSTDKDTVTAQLGRAHIPLSGLFAPQSDHYLKFLVQELKPYIDKNYSVHTDRENTYIAGSSMGGLISLYAICEYPEVFGGAACLSTHWVGTFTPEHNPVPDAFLDYLERNLPDPKQHLIYFDCGDATLDRLYPDIQKRVDQIMVKAGYDEGNWHTRHFPGENHSEDAWSKRFHVPLAFLMGK